MSDKLGELNIKPLLYELRLRELVDLANRLMRDRTIRDLAEIAYDSGIEMDFCLIDKNEREG